MQEFGGQGTLCSLARKGKLLVAAVALSFMLTACGGGDDSPAASAASPRGAQPGPAGAPTSPGGALADAGASPSGSGAAPTTDSPAPPSSEEEGGPGAAETASVTLSWIPPTMNDDGSPLKLTGYRIYWGTSKEDLEHSVLVDNPGLTRYVVEQLSAGTWYFVATALSGDRESEFSNVFSTTIR